MEKKIFKRMMAGLPLLALALLMWGNTAGAGPLQTGKKAAVIRMSGASFLMGRTLPDGSMSDRERWLSKTG